MTGTKRLVIILIAAMLAAYVPVRQGGYVCEASVMKTSAVEKDAESIELEASENELPVEQGYETVYFYAYTNMDVPAIALIDQESNQAVGMMVDDADYHVSGDEDKGDGIYTCKVQINTSQEKEYNFFAQYTDSSKIIASESVQIEIFTGFTDQELDEMDEADKKLSKLLRSKKFQHLLLKDKEKQMHSLLVSLAEKGTKKLPYPLIKKDTIYHDKDSHNFFFTYSCGVLGSVMIVDYDGCIPDFIAPTTNIKNGKTYKPGKKITFSDKESGMVSAKLDGKTIKYGHVVKKKGKHELVLIDLAGNKKTVKFKIK